MDADGRCSLPDARKQGLQYEVQRPLGRLGRGEEATAPEISPSDADSGVLTSLPRPVEAGQAPTGSMIDCLYFSDQCMCITYGDGTKLQTLTALDVAAHEFAHGVCMTSAGLIYKKESGGLNEANSDIMGAMAEFYMRGANGKGSVIPDTGGTWTQGEQITTPAFPLKMRFLYKPSKDGKSADAWSPTLQNLNVHYSSGPMNRAFYFLSLGATKTGETSSSFLPQGMSGIGNDKAARIWYHA